MAITDSLSCLRRLPRGRQVELWTAALGQPHEEVQLAAMRALVDPQHLDRPDLVVDRYDELLPSVRSAAESHREPLVRAARVRMAAVDAGRQRLSACRLIAAIGGPTGVNTLVTALTDPLPEIRDEATNALPSVAANHRRETS